MKSLKDISLNLSEEEYHEYPAWSYSLISRYAKDGFGAIATLHDKFVATPSMEFGSLFDSMITKGKATLDEYVVDFTGITIPPAEKSVFDKLLELGYGKYSYDTLAGPAFGTLSEVMHSCDTFCSKYKKDETRLAKLAENAGYWELIRTGKKVVSKEDWDDAVEMYNVFRNDEYLKTLFGTKNTKDVEYIYQAQFKVPWSIDGQEIEIKIMPDLLVVNHKDKTIQPVDLKTSSAPAWSFKDNFLKYRYDLQAELYTAVLRKITSQRGEASEYESYEILPYLFTDISRTDKVPVTYKYDPTNGFSYTKGGKEYKYKGWRELLSDILEYEKTEAKVPNYITTKGPNDLISIISRNEISTGK
jgi:hypothetical protein